MAVEERGYGAAIPGARGALWSPILRLINQLLHLFAAAAAVGVPFFIAVFMIPRLEAQGAAETIPNVVDRFYSVLPWVQLAIFFTTGLFNYIFWLADTGYRPKESLRTAYVKALIVKVLLAHVLVGFGIAFGLVGAMQEDARTWAWVLFGVGITILFISAGLRRSPTQLRRAQPGLRQAA